MEKFKKISLDVIRRANQNMIDKGIVEKYKTIHENKVVINPSQDKNRDNLLIEVQGGIIKIIEKLILRTPNDMELGEAIREMFSHKNN